MTRERVTALRAWLKGAGFADVRAGFGSVFGDRSDPVFRRHVGELAWGTFAWFASEPENLILLESGPVAARRMIDELTQPSPD